MSDRPLPSRSTVCTLRPAGHVPLATAPVPVTFIIQAPVVALYVSVSATPSPLKSVIELPMFDVPGCVMLSDRPAIVTVAVRAALPVFACTCSDVVPLPLVGAVGLETVIHGTGLDAVQLHADVVVTPTDSAPPAMPTD